MAYLGRAVDSGAISNIENLDNITFDGSSSYSLTKNSVAFVPASASNLLISIDGVVNATNFTVSGSTIDFGVAVSSSSVCNFIIHLGVGIITAPSDGSVTTAKIQDDAVTKDKVSNLMYPAFEAYLSSDQSGNGDNVTAKLQADTEVYDTDSCYDNSTNYRFTPNVAGKYFVYHSSKIQCDTANTMAFMHVRLYKNGSEYKKVSFDPTDNQATSTTLFCGAVIDFNGTTDYVEAYGLMNTSGSGNTWRFDAEVKSCSFGAYRIGD